MSTPRCISHVAAVWHSVCGITSSPSFAAVLAVVHERRSLRTLVPW
jgi:hypothetical protein